MIQGLPRTAAYAAAKAGIFTLTQIASLEAGQYGVRVNALAPLGLTRMVASSGLTDVDAASKVPEPDEMDVDSPQNPLNAAPLVAWLLSDQAQYVTGQIFKMAGASFTRVGPLKWGPFQHPPSGQTRWRIDQLGDVMAAEVFGSQFQPPKRQLPDGTTVPYYTLRHD
jgi:hypothetical protein